MAGMFGYSSTATGVSALRTVVSVATPATGPGIKVKSFWIAGKGVNAAEAPMLVELGQATTGLTSTAGTIYAVNHGSGSSQCTVNTATEGTPTMSRSRFYYVAPTGMLIMQEVLGQEFFVPSNTFLRLRVTPAASVDLAFGLEWEE